MYWTNQQVSTAARILGKHKRVCDALPDIEKSVNRTVTVDSLKHAMKQRGMKAPSFYLQADLVNEAARKAESAWIRNIDQNVIDALDTVIRPVDGFVDVCNVTGHPLPYSVRNFSRPVTVPYLEDEKQEKVSKIMVMPDAHIPDHDLVAWKVFLKSLKAVKPDVLVLIGDYCDLTSVSAHPKKPTDERSLKHEVEFVNKSLDELQEAYSGRIVYCFGNHEHRAERYLNNNAPELDGLVHLKDLLKLKERGIEYHAYGEFVRIGEMIFVHDTGRCGVNTARATLMDVGDNVCVGHSHRASVVYGGTVDGKTHVCINTGWIGKYSAISYRNINTAKREWQHAFTLIYQDSKGVSYCNLIPIINGECIVDGKFIKA